MRAAEYPGRGPESALLSARAAPSLQALLLVRGPLDDEG
jgi:hypothetical protein